MSPIRRCEECNLGIDHKRRDARFCDRRCKNRAAERRRAPRDRPERRASPDRRRSPTRFVSSEAERDELRRQYYRERYRRNREKVLDYQKRRYAENPERFREYARRYRRSNPQRRRTQGDRRAALIESHPDYRPFSERDWLRLVRRHGNRCAYCGERPERLEQDHVVPISRGGRHAIGNILPACKTCNISKYNYFLVEWKLRQAQRG